MSREGLRCECPANVGSMFDSPLFGNRRFSSWRQGAGIGTEGQIKLLCGDSSILSFFGSSTWIGLLACIDKGNYFVFPTSPREHLYRHLG